MGVKTLWSILNPISEKTDLRELSCSSEDGRRRSVVAVDLAGWLVQDNSVKYGRSVVSKPHLRNLFFRTAALLSLGIDPIFIRDGDAPELKKGTMIQRKNAEFGNEAKEVKSLSRSRLKSLMKESEEFLSALGLKCLTSNGEAEALCASLKVDAVISDDSDVFCYGAQVVWRNFSISSKSFSVDRFDMAKISEFLKLDRKRMIFLAVFLGCDFCPTGVPGVGKESMMTMFRLWDISWNALDILDHWINSEFRDTEICSYPCSENRCCLYCEIVSKNDCVCSKYCRDLIKIENSIKKKCRNSVDSNFWSSTYREILDEFRQKKKNGKQVLLGEESIKKFAVPRIPDLKKIIDIMVQRLAWLEQYSFEKALPILTKWQISSIDAGQEPVLKPVEILRKRTVNGVPSLEIKWEFLKSNMRDNYCDYELITVEPINLLEINYRRQVEDFLQSKTKSKVSKTKKSKKSATESEGETKPITAYFGEKKKQLKSAKLETNFAKSETNFAKSETNFAKSETNSAKSETNSAKSASKNEIKPAKTKKKEKRKNNWSINSLNSEIENLEDDFKENRGGQIKWGATNFLDSEIENVENVTFDNNESVLNEEDCSDLSMIIDDILSQKVTESLKIKTQIQTSTPTVGRRTKPDVKLDDLLEDSFDRMCGPGPFARLKY